MRLFYHPESDSLFWDHFASDPLCEDVTGITKFHDAAEARGIKCPGPVTIDARPMLKGLEKAKGLAGAITKGLATWDRKPADFYPTPFDVTESLIPVLEAIKDRVAPVRPLKVWEPACGDLDMTRVLEWHGYEVTSTDLRDDAQGIGGIDFLNDDVTAKYGWEPDPDVIITNPPFNLAAQFITKALEYTPNVAMLVKIDYWNAVSRLPLWERHIPAFFLPLTWRPAFLKAERGNSPLMNCAWAVWTEVADEGICAVEPLRKRVYPGYQGNGLRTSMSKLGQAMGDLAETVRGRTNS